VVAVAVDAVQQLLSRCEWTADVRIGSLNDAGGHSGNDEQPPPGAAAIAAVTAAAAASAQRKSTSEKAPLERGEAFETLTLHIWLWRVYLVSDSWK
jgi:hypothetical protein